MPQYVNSFCNNIHNFIRNMSCVTISSSFLHFNKNLFSGIILLTVLQANAIETATQGRTPIVHREYYRGERELNGYTPEYNPGVVSFSNSNKAYIRRGNHIYTLNDSGKWIDIDFSSFIKKQYPKQNCKVNDSVHTDERIAFDNHNDAYMHVTIDRGSSSWKSLLMHSADAGKTWKAYEIPFPQANVKLEIAEPGNSYDAPTILLCNKNNLYLQTIAKSPDENLQLKDPVLVSPKAYGFALHSGASNAAITRNGKTYIVYATSLQHGSDQGTAQYIITYDHKSGKLSEPQFIGTNGHGKPDCHNVPSLSIDPKGFIHVMLGSHHDPFKYIHSLKPYDVGAWTSPVEVGEPKRKICEGSYTYQGVARDPFGNFHLVSRWAGDGYKNYLVYQSKKHDGSWTEHKKLVEPFKTLYSVWYHKMTIDRKGRIFLNYCYYGNELTEPTAKAYNAKWPKEKLDIPADIGDYPNGKWFNVEPHDLVIIVSNDSGNSWRLALTEDFAASEATVMTPGEEKVNSIGMPLVKINPGKFIMGSLGGASDEKPVRPVSITNSYYLGKYPVTVGDFKKFTQETGYKTTLERTPPKTWHSWLKGKVTPSDTISWKNPPFPQDDSHPVTLVNIEDAWAFCLWLSKKEGRSYRLPSEAEWEYACRAGSLCEYAFGDSSEQLDQYGWYKKNSSSGTMPVGKLKPNGLGLHDMHGNVWEWCSDYYILPSDMPENNPRKSAFSQSGPVIKGGSWFDDAHGDGDGFNLRSASRYHIVYPRVKTDWVGFRILMENENGENK